MSTKPRRSNSILASLAAFYTNTATFSGSNFLLHPISSWMKQIHHALIIGEREMLEFNPHFRQVLPYTVLRRPRGDTYEYLVYQRTQKVGESRLGSKYSIGWGGHIDLKDVVYGHDSVIKLPETMSAALRRELDEELEAYIDPDGETLGDIEAVIEGHVTTVFINDNASPVEEVHSGVCLILEVEENWQFRCREDELIMVGWRTAEEIENTLVKYEQDGEMLDATMYDRLERWSMLLIDNRNKTECTAFVRVPDVLFTFDDLFGVVREKIPYSGVSGAFVTGDPKLAYSTLTSKTRMIFDSEIADQVEPVLRQAFSMKLSPDDPNPEQTVDNAVQIAKRMYDQAAKDIPSGGAKVPSFNIVDAIVKANELRKVIQGRQVAIQEQIITVRAAGVTPEQVDDERLTVFFALWHEGAGTSDKYLGAEMKFARGVTKELIEQRNDDIAKMILGGCLQDTWLKPAAGVTAQIPASEMPIERKYQNSSLSGEHVSGNEEFIKLRVLPKPMGVSIPVDKYLAEISGCGPNGIGGLRIGDAITAAVSGKVIWRDAWEKGRYVKLRDGALYLRNSTLTYWITAEDARSSDWVVADRAPIAVDQIIGIHGWMMAEDLEMLAHGGYINAITRSNELMVENYLLPAIPKAKAYFAPNKNNDVIERVSWVKEGDEWVFYINGLPCPYEKVDPRDIPEDGKVLTLHCDHITMKPKQ